MRTIKARQFQCSFERQSNNMGDKSLRLETIDIKKHLENWLVY